MPKNEEKFVSLLGDMPYTKIADQFEFLSKNADEEIEFLSKMKDQIKLFEVVKGSMDDVFLNAVGQTIRGEVK